ncbi:MAG: hypothetical protein PHW31_01930 [Candidatus Pacebacteria bacterium]|nr:hypothetical protein [Candidatus Paceibacterota bacterium]
MKEKGNKAEKTEEEKSERQRDTEDVEDSRDICPIVYRYGRPYKVMKNGKLVPFTL